MFHRVDHYSNRLSPYSQKFDSSEKENSLAYLAPLLVMEKRFYNIFLFNFTLSNKLECFSPAGFFKLYTIPHFMGKLELSLPVINTQN
jgi:hypothetical protein